MTRWGLECTLGNGSRIEGSAVEVVGLKKIAFSPHVKPWSAIAGAVPIHRAAFHGAILSTDRVDHDLLDDLRVPSHFVSQVRCIQQIEDRSFASTYDEVRAR